MPDKISKLLSQPGFLLGSAGLAALTFNNWLLAPVLNNRLFAKEGSVSEFSAVTQPHYWVFRSLDIFSGLVFILLSLAISRQVEQTSRPRNLLLWSTFILGAANIFDASFTLPCSETLDSACKIAVNLSPSHFQMPSHGWSSIVLAICYFTLPLAGYLYAVSQKHRQLMIVSALVIAVAIESFLSAVLQYATKQSFSVKAVGAGQEIQMMLLGFWFIYLGWTVYSRRTAIGLESSGAKPR